MYLPILKKKGYPIVFFVSCLWLFGCSKGSSNHVSDTPPNIILIITDDQGWGDLSKNGNTQISTPNLDRMAENGVSFDRFFVAPVCSPTRAELLTGRYHVRSGVYSTSAGGERMNVEETTLAQIFQQAGYATAAYGKWHNGMQPPYHPNARGFDDFYGFCSGHWGNYFDPLLEHNGKILQGKGFLTDDLTNRGIEFMEAHQNQPFFLYLPFNTPHSPMQVPDRWWKKFEDQPLSLKGTIAEREKEVHTRAALAMCENIDWNVGRIVDKVASFGMADNTILLFLSDNGPNGHRWNGGMKGTKGSTDEGGVRSPLMMQWKQHFKAGTTIPQITAAIDLLPTLAELAGIPYPTKYPLDGISFKPLLVEENPQWEDRLLINNWKDKTSVRSQRYRLGHEGQLFDMVQDPNQIKDIAAQQPTVLERLQKAKEQFLKEVYSELPKEDTRPFPIGDPNFSFTQLPARDAQIEGNIQRSNRWPNCSFYTNWIDASDKISWQAEVLTSGTYEVTLYYTCPAASVGSSIELRFNNASLATKIQAAHDPPLMGMEHDRFERGESYVKDFRPMKMGRINLEKGKRELALVATEIPGKEVMDFRMLLFHRVE